MIDRTNKNWNKTISDEEIFNREFSIGYLIQSNQQWEFFQELKDKILSTYKVTAKFKYLGCNGDSIFANGQRLVWRQKRDGDFHLGKNVKIMEHNLSHKGGGSHKYPSVSYAGAECVLEFISYGLPYVDRVNGWSIEIISLQKVD